VKQHRIMGVPFSHEVQRASHHIDSIAPLAKIALITLTLASVIITILLVAILYALVALMITVNPDLVEERKRLVTPFFKAWLKVPAMLVGIPSADTAIMQTERSHQRDGYRKDTQYRQ
jgi:hypothetical protein